MNMEITKVDQGQLPKSLQSLKSVFIRGNAVRYLSLDKTEIGKEKIDKITSECRLANQ